ncbi:hypothetical protein TWF281_003553 [Arthrobotrys megalospora]
MSSSEDETARILRQQAEDLGDHRVTALPLGDRQPGRRGQFQRPGPGRFHGPGDARFILGPRPGGSGPGSSAAAVREREVPIEPRWLEIFDDSKVMERKDGLGGGELHRAGENFRPRRRSFSDASDPRSARASLANETKHMATKNPVGPSSFRGGRGGGNRPNFVLGDRPRDKGYTGPPVQPRNQITTFQPRAPPRGPAPHPRAPRPVIPGGERAGNWGAPGLVHDQGAFFDKMTKNTGLRCPPMVKNQQEGSKNAKPLAKPMASAKDLVQGATVAGIEKSDQPVGPPKQMIEQPKQTIEKPKQAVEQPKRTVEPPKHPAEPSKQPAEPPNQSVEPPRRPVYPSEKPIDPDQPVDRHKLKPSTSGFVPPHLRHALKKKDPAGTMVIEVPQPHAKEPATQPSTPQVSSPVQAPVEQQPIAERAGKEFLPAVEAARTVPGISTPPAFRSVTPEASSGERQRLLLPQEESKAPLFQVPKATGKASDEFTKGFWELVAKPLWGDLLEDYNDVHQQIIFLTCYYAERPEEWQDIMENGPPTRETLFEITRRSIEKDRKEELAKHRAEQKKVENILSPKLGSAPQPPDTWWRLDVSDTSISDWADQLQEHHRQAMIQSIKDQIKDEKNPIRNQILYAKIGILLHGSNEKAAKANDSGTQGQESMGVPNQTAKRSTKVSGRSNGDVSLLDLDREEPRNGNREEGSPSDPAMWEIDLPPEEEEKEDVLTEDQFPLTEEQNWSPEPELPIPEGELLIPEPELTTSDRENRFDRSHSPGRIPPYQPLVSIHSGASTPRESSDERREREKKQRMEEINQQFAAKKNTHARGIDGHQESPPKLQEFPAFLLDLGPDATYEIIPPGAVGQAEESAEEEILEEDSFLDTEGYSTDGFLAIDEILNAQPAIPEEDLRKVRQMNRDSISGLAVTCPWKLAIRFTSPVKPGEYFTIQVRCTEKMPDDFLRKLRGKVGGEHWQELALHPEFRAIVARATKMFYRKMARKWGAQFIHGIAD